MPCHDVLAYVFIVKEYHNAIENEFGGVHLVNALIWVNSLKLLLIFSFKLDLDTK